MVHSILCTHSSNILVGITARQEETGSIGVLTRRQVMGWKAGNRAMETS